MTSKKNKLEEGAEKATYLFVSASPGAFKIFTLLILGAISNSIQSEVANDLAIINFMTMLTAIGAGTHLLHITPKRDGASEYEAYATLKPSLIKLIPLTLIVCIVLFLINKEAYKILSSASEASILLFTSSLYWIFRHYHLARENKRQLVIMEIWLWLCTSLAIILLTTFHALSTKTFLISLSLAYTASFIKQLTRVALHPTTHKIKITRAALSIGLSNLVSGGLINLAPSICYNLGNSSITGMVGLIINTTSITLTIIRAQLYRASPKISESILKNKEDTQRTCQDTQSRITKSIIITSLALQPINVILAIKTQNMHDAPSILIYSILITLLICTPQLCAVNSVVANFIGRTNSLLLANLVHATFTLASTYAIYRSTNDGSITFTAFLSISSTLFIMRNIFINHDILRKTKKLTTQTTQTTQ